MLKILGLSSDGLLGYEAPLGFFSALGGHFLDAGTSLFRPRGTRLFMLFMQLARLTLKMPYDTALG